MVHRCTADCAASRGHHGSAAATPPQSPARSARLPHLESQQKATQSTTVGPRVPQPQRPATHAGGESRSIPALRPQPPTAKGKGGDSSTGKQTNASGIAPRRTEGKLLDSASRTPVRQSPLEGSVDPAVEATATATARRASSKPEPPTPSKGKSGQAFGGRRPSSCPVTQRWR